MAQQAYSAVLCASKQFAAIDNAGDPVQKACKEGWDASTTEAARVGDALPAITEG